MELHGYLDHGVYVLSHPDGHHEPEILQRFYEIEFVDLDLEAAIKLKLDGSQDEALFRMLLLAQCTTLASAIPVLFDDPDGIAALLLTSNLLHQYSIMRDLVRSVDISAWKEIEVIGWLYQFYNSERKDEVMGSRVEVEDLPAATQLFTLDWIVKYLVQNSLGTLWLETIPGFLMTLPSILKSSLVLHGSERAWKKILVL